MNNKDKKMLEESYKQIRLNERIGSNDILTSPVLNAAGYGLAGGIGRLGRNLKNAITGSEENPQSPWGVTKTGFAEKLQIEAIEAVIRAFNLDPSKMTEIKNYLVNLQNQLEPSQYPNDGAAAAKGIYNKKWNSIKDSK